MNLRAVVVDDYWHHHDYYYYFYNVIVIVVIIFVVFLLSIKLHSLWISSHWSNILFPLIILFHIHWPLLRNGFLHGKRILRILRSSCIWSWCCCKKEEDVLQLPFGIVRYVVLYVNKMLQRAKRPIGIVHQVFPSRNYPLTQTPN